LLQSSQQEFHAAEIAGWVRSSPAIGSDGTLYIGSDDKKLYAIKTDSKGLAKSPWPMRGQNARHTGRVMKK
jgi:outer membrane protein assembly factor BamB